MSDGLRRNPVSRAADLDAVDACILSRCDQAALILVNPGGGQRASGLTHSDFFATGIACNRNLDDCFAARHPDMQTPGLGRPLPTADVGYPVAQLGR